MNENIKEKILLCSEKYYNEFLKPLEPKRDVMLEDSWEALCFFLDRVFYQGRRDRVSDKVKNEIKAVLEEFVRSKGSQALYDRQNHEYLKQHLSSRIGKGKIGKELDIKLTIDLLDFAVSVSKNNLVKFLKDNFQVGRVRGLFEKLDSIKGIGPKISSFILRDFSVLYELDRNLTEEDYIVLQPIDTWVKKVGLKLGLYSDAKASEEIIRKSIVEYCLKQELSPPRFNQGMWYYGFVELNNVRDP